MKIKGIISSKKSKIKKVYEEYLKVIKEGEIGLTECWMTDSSVSEKKLIELLEKRIKGEKIKFPYND